MFQIRNLSVGHYCQGFTFWHYQAPTERLADIYREGYMNSADVVLKRGDMISISALDGAVIYRVKTVMLGLVELAHLGADQ